jgi:hypothetical protein
LLLLSAGDCRSLRGSFVDGLFPKSSSADHRHGARTMLDDGIASCGPYASGSWSVELLQMSVMSAMSRKKVWNTTSTGTVAKALKNTVARHSFPDSY